MSTQMFSALDAATEAALRASIERFGVLVPVVKDQNGRILDGHHRVALAEEVGAEYDVSVYEIVDEHEAQEIARTLNADRRHLSAEQRKEVAAALHQDGHSYRAIGRALGHSDSTIRDDVKSTARDRAVDRVIGLDGKSRPAAMPQPKPKIDHRRLVSSVRNMHKVMGTFEGMGLDVFPLETAIAGATQEDLASWGRTASETISHLSRFRRALREARNGSA